MISNKLNIRKYGKKFRITILTSGENLVLKNQ